MNNDPFAATAWLELVEDERGRLCRRAEWLANERRVVAECLYHAIVATGVRSGDGPDGTPRAGGGALSATDAKAVMELFAEVATPTVARACADARARSLDAGRAQAAAAQELFAVGGVFDEYSGVPGGASPPTIADLPASVQEDLPAALAIALAAVAAVTPNGGSNGGSTTTNGAKSYAQVVEAASAALQKAVDDANERAGGSAPVKIDPLRALGDYPFLNQSQRDQRDRFGFDGQQQPWQQQQQQAAAYGSPFAVPGQATRVGGHVRGRFCGAGNVGNVRRTHGQYGQNDPHFFGGGDAPGMMGPNDAGALPPGGDKSADEEEEERVSQMTIGVLEFCRLACALTGLDLGRKDADVAASVAADAGALTAARAMLCTCAFQDDADVSRRSYLDLVHAVIRRAIAHMLKNPAVGEALAAVVPAPTQQQVERERAALEHWESNSLFETDAELQRQREEEEERLRLQKEEEDASREAPLTALCGLLSEVYSQAPDLPAAAADVLPGFLDAIVEWEHSVESLVGVVGLMAAVAGTGPEGASQIWSRTPHRVRASPGTPSSARWWVTTGVPVQRTPAGARGERAIRRGGWRLRRLRRRGGFRGGYGNAVGPTRTPPPFLGSARCPRLTSRASPRPRPLASLLRAAPPGEASAWTQWLEGRCGFSLLDALTALHAARFRRSSRRPSRRHRVHGAGIRARVRGRGREEREVAERGALESSSNPMAPNFADVRSP